MAISRCLCSTVYMKSKFKDESEILYRDAIEKYSKLEDAEPLSEAAHGVS